MKITMHILFAEDKISYKQQVEAALRAAGYDVTAVENGADAIDALQHTSFDLVLTDYCMPLKNGEDVAREAKAKGVAHVIINTAMQPGSIQKISGVEITSKMEVQALVRKIQTLLGD